jgi:hypothetical protein
MVKGKTWLRIELKAPDEKKTIAWTKKDMPTSSRIVNWLGSEETY